MYVVIRKYPLPLRRQLWYAHAMLFNLTLLGVTIFGLGVSESIVFLTLFGIELEFGLRAKRGTDG